MVAKKIHLKLHKQEKCPLFFRKMFLFPQTYFPYLRLPQLGADQEKHPAQIGNRPDNRGNIGKGF